MGIVIPTDSDGQVAGSQAGPVHRHKPIRHSDTVAYMKTAIQHYTSRTADKFVVRLPQGMRDRIAEVAKQHHRSMNSEIIARLEHSLLDLPSLPEQPSRQMLNDQSLDGLTNTEQELLVRFREMSRRQQNALLALLVDEAS
jgi:hypothetical protein